MGKYVNKEKKNFRFLVWILSIFVVVVGIVLVVSCRSDKNVAENEICTEDVGVQNPDVQDYEEQNIISSGNFGYETPYFTVEYPVKWLDYLSLSDSEDSGVYALCYSYVRDGEETPLAILYVGEQESGFSIGTFTLGGEVYQVSIDFCMIDEREWTADDVSRFAAMQEDMNELIMQLRALDNFQTE